MLDINLISVNADIVLRHEFSRVQPGVDHTLLVMPEILRIAYGTTHEDDYNMLVAGCYLQQDPRYWSPVEPWKLGERICTRQESRLLHMAEIAAMQSAWAGPHVARFNALGCNQMGGEIACDVFLGAGKFRPLMIDYFVKEARRAA